MDNVEITDEMLKRWEIESESEKLFGPHIVSALCKALKSERAERAKNPGVWNEAPENATVCAVQYALREWVGYDLKPSTRYIRVPPKTKAREIAEKWAEKFANTGKAVEIIEAAILEAQAQKN